MYYCDCVEAWEDKGKPFKKSGGYHVNGITQSQHVETKNGMCVHCGYAAVWSKAPISTIGITSIALAEANDRAKVQAEIIRLRGAGYTIEQLSNEFNLAVNTVRTYLGLNK